jgi:hypothetical protein
MFCKRHEELRQIDYKREKEWMNVHLGCEHVWGEFHVIHTWKKKLETLEFGTSGLAMLISNVLS